MQCTAQVDRLSELVIEQESTIKILQNELHEARNTVDELQIALANTETLASEVASLRSAVEAEKLKAKRYWWMRCEQMLEQNVMQAKEAEIARLCEELTIARATVLSAISSPVVTLPGTSPAREYLTTWNVVE